MMIPCRVPTKKRMLRCAHICCTDAQNDVPRGALQCIPCCWRLRRTFVLGA
jgi:hypothetical protein